MSYRCDLLVKALWSDKIEEYERISKISRIKVNLGKNGYASITLSDTFVLADEVVTVRRSKGGGTLRVIEVICPRCGRVGRLVIGKRAVRGYKYYVKHSDGTICTFTVDSPHWEFLDKVYRLIRQEWRL